MIISKASFFIALFFLVHTVYGQNNPYNEVSIASPTAASLGKYADIPVNNHTGIPDISIPIYTIRQGSLELPVSLSYHAGGIKVMEAASWVGMGWSLNAGGVITRTVRGAPDERGTSSVDGQTHGHFSDYGFAYYSNYEEGNSQGQDFMKGKRDGEPDLFSFNVGGLSGKFYFRDDRTPVFEPQQDIKVEYNYTGVGSIQSFILTATNGVRYHFGIRNEPSKAIPVERSNPVTAQSGYVQGTVISSWYLSKIETTDGLQSILLHYDAENYSSYTISMFPIDPDIKKDDMYQNKNEYNLIKNVVNGVRLSGITFSNGKLSFIPAISAREDLSNASTVIEPEVVNSEAKPLDRIEIDDNGGFCKKFVFNYSYFQSAASLPGYFHDYNIISDKKRLKLNSIQELSCTGALSIPPYNFEYVSDTMMRRLSFAQDHWGFFNGVGTNADLIPTYTLNDFTEVVGANRDANAGAMSQGILKKINYPTGGYSEFQFEANSTWAESVKYNESFAFTTSMGYGNTSGYPVETFKQLNQNVYKISISSASYGTSTTGMGSVKIYDANNNNIFTLAVAPGENKTEMFRVLTAGTYKIVIFKNTIQGSADGISSTFREMVPYNHAREEIVGGLRVKKIKHNSGGTAPDMETNYSYLATNGKVSGILYGRPVYVQVLRNDEIAEATVEGTSSTMPVTSICNPTGCISCDVLSAGSEVSYLISPSAIRPLGSSQGNHIGYNEVKISKTGAGFSIYRYYGSDRWDAELNDIVIRNAKISPPCSLSIPNYPDAPLPFEPKRGNLKYEAHYKEGQNTPVKEAWYYYTFQEEPIKTRGRIQTFLKALFGTYYEIKALKKTEQKVEESIYDGNLSLTTTTTTFFESPFHYQPTRTLTVNSKGQNIETKFKYPLDYRLTSCDVITDGRQTYSNDVSAHTTYYQQQKAQCTTAGCVKTNYINYRTNLDSARRKFINTRLNYLNQALAGSFTKCRNDAKVAADAELKPVFELQDQHIFTPLETTEWKNGNLIKAGFNRFDYVSNPTGKVYLNKIFSLHPTSFASSFSSSAISGSTLSKDNRYTVETSLKFDAGNLVELIKKAGVTTSIIWGYNNSLPVVKASGVSYATLKNAYDAVNGNPSFRINTNLANALVTSYTYQPIVGITGETDPRSRNITYVYDALGRLQLIKDHDGNILKTYQYQFQQAQ